MAGEAKTDGPTVRKMPFSVVAVACTAFALLAAYGLVNRHARNLAQQTRVAGRPDFITADSRRRAIESFYRPELIGGMVHSNDLPAIRRWLARHPADKGTFFGAAIGEGKPEIMNMLLASGYRPSNDPVAYRDGAGRERSQPRLQLALAIACSAGHASVAKILFGLGARPNGFDTLGCPLLALAAARGRTEVVQLLLDRGAPVNGAADILPNTVSDGESGQPSLESIRLRDISGKTALHLAAEYRHPRVVRLLLEHGANPRRATPDGATALQLCRAGGPSARGVGIREEARPGSSDSPRTEVESLLKGALR